MLIYVTFYQMDVVKLNEAVRLGFCNVSNANVTWCSTRFRPAAWQEGFQQPEVREKKYSEIVRRSGNKSERFATFTPFLHPHLTPASCIRWAQLREKLRQLPSLPVHVRVTRPAMCG